MTYLKPVLPPKFKSLALVDLTAISADLRAKLQTLSATPLIAVSTLGQLKKNRKSKSIDGLLFSLKTDLQKRDLESFPQLRHLALFGTNLSRVDLNVAKSRGISVSHVTHYCEYETAEFILAEILALARGVHGKMWKTLPTSLRGKNLGIIGLGGVGGALATLAQSLGMQVRYFSRTRKLDFEQNGVQFQNLNDLVQSSDMISLTVPPHTLVLESRHFEQMNPSALLINTCIGEIFRKTDVVRWLRRKDGWLVLDEIATRSYPSPRKWPKVGSRVITFSRPAFVSLEASSRLEQRFFQNIAQAAKERELD